MDKINVKLFVLVIILQILLIWEFFWTNKDFLSQEILITS